MIGYDVTGGERIKETRHRATERNDVITYYCAWSIAGVGNRQSIAGRIDCMILSAGHIHSQFENFVLKIHNITSQIY